MLELLSDINLCSRFDISDATLLSGVAQGSFVSWDGGAPASGESAYAIWTENRGSEWSSDKGASGQVTILYGNYRAKTSECVAGDAYTAGKPVYVDSDGKLTITSTGNSAVVGYAIGEEASYSWLGNSYAKVVEFVSA
ncbi:MAG: DUF2190 family protein [Rhodobacteraceae bacterium]|nr:DUF2190 family protein [Paracoccaceae bacterium]